MLPPPLLLMLLVRDSSLVNRQITTNDEVTMMVLRVLSEMGSQSCTVSSVCSE